jgi:hypothetical protein
VSNKVAEHQVDPIKNDKPCVQDMVIADIEARKGVGIERYGTVLQPFNGRDALLDAYQEALDLCQYLRQMIYEQEHTITEKDWVHALLRKVSLARLKATFENHISARMQIAGEALDLVEKVLAEKA